MSGQVNASLVRVHSLVHDNSLKIRGREGEEKEGKEKKAKKKKSYFRKPWTATRRKKEIEGMRLGEMYV